MVKITAMMMLMTLLLMLILWSRGVMLGYIVQVFWWCGWNSMSKRRKNVDTSKSSLTKAKRQHSHASKVPGEWSRRCRIRGVARCGPSPDAEAGSFGGFPRFTVATLHLSRTSQHTQRQKEVPGQQRSGIRWWSWEQLRRGGLFDHYREGSFV